MRVRQRPTAAAFGNLCPKSNWDKSQSEIQNEKKKKKIRKVKTHGKHQRQRNFYIKRQAFKFYHAWTGHFFS